MSRQSITLTRPNDDWLKDQVDSEEYTSKSEVVNDLIRKARALEEQKNLLINEKLAQAEKRGFTNLGKEEILALAKKSIR